MLFRLLVVGGGEFLFVERNRFLAHRFEVNILAQFAALRR